jgi:hypothetical protein
MKTSILAMLFCFTLTNLMAQAQPEPERDLDESIKHYNKVSVELSAEMDRIAKRVRTADSLHQIRTAGLSLTIQKLHHESKRNREVIAENEKQQIRIKAEYLANMKTLRVMLNADSIL